MCANSQHLNKGIQFHANQLRLKSRELSQGVNVSNRTHSRSSCEAGVRLSVLPPPVLRPLSHTCPHCQVASRHKCCQAGGVFREERERGNLPTHPPTPCVILTSFVHKHSLKSSYKIAPPSSSNTPGLPPPLLNVSGCSSLKLR